MFWGQQGCPIFGRREAFLSANDTESQPETLTSDLPWDGQRERLRLQEYIPIDYHFHVSTYWLVIELSKAWWSLIIIQWCTVVCVCVLVCVLTCVWMVSVHVIEPSLVNLPADSRSEDCPEEVIITLIIQSFCLPYPQYCSYWQTFGLQPNYFTPYYTSAAYAAQHPK